MVKNGEAVGVGATGLSKRASYRFSGEKVLAFGDLHLSAMFQGSHKDYTFECYETMDKILGIVRSEKPSAVFFLGDICGVSERKITDRQFLMRVIQFFGELYNVTKGNVYSVKGNHDMGDFTDFDFLVGLGYLKNPKYVDFYRGNDLGARFHFVNYGDEKLQLEVHDVASNVVLGHADYYIDGVTNWYGDKKGMVELKTLKNYSGVELVLSGHIHVPSREVVYTNLESGEAIGLFYVGSPSRVSDVYDDCWYAVFDYSEGQDAVGYDIKYMNLRKASEIFVESKLEKQVSEEDGVSKQKEDNLSAIVKEIFESQLSTGDLFSQIDRIVADDDTKKLAKDYLNKAMNEEKKN